MNSTFAINAQNLSKVYRITRRSSDSVTAAEAVLDRLRHPTRRPTVEKFAALSDLSFEIPWGEAVGILGSNGAGKSTLLKVLTRVTAPTSGRIRIEGRVGSLLEVGTGFHPELTGRENIFLNGSLLGMRSKEIRRRFDEIVDFSGVQRFLDTPVKRYSSGMYVRLAFSIAAHLESEILAIDEVLAVGDAEFREQSLAKMREVAKTGRTVLYVSHQVQTVRSLCTSAILLERGLLRQHGGVDDCLEAYRKSFAALQAHNTEPDNRPGSGFARFLMARMSKEVYEPADEKVIDFGIEAGDRLVGKFYVSCHINDDSGATVLQCDSRLVGFWVEPGTETSGRLTISTPWLKPGKYSVDLYAIQEGALDVWEHACHFEVLPVLPYPQTTTDDAVAFSPILSDFEYREW